MSVVSENTAIRRELVSAVPSKIKNPNIEPWREGVVKKAIPPATTEAFKMHRKLRKIPGFVTKLGGFGIISPKLMYKKVIRDKTCHIVPLDAPESEFANIGRLSICPETKEKKIKYDHTEKECKFDIKKYFEKNYNYKSARCHYSKKMEVEIPTREERFKIKRFSPITKLDQKNRQAEYPSASSKDL